MKIAAVGDNCMDVYDNLGTAYPGGNPVNVAVYTVRLGGNASYTGVVGNDPYGKQMQESIAAKGVDVSHIRVKGGKTAVSHVELIDGNRVFGDYEEGVLAGFQLTEDEIDFICTHDLAVTGLWGNVHNQLAELKRKGILIAYDAAIRPYEEGAQTALLSADYFFMASDDGDTKELRNIMMEYQKKGPKVVICTLGEKGSLAYDGKIFTSCGIVPCDVVDTMGAGDSYIAGFLKGVLEGKDLRACMQSGAETASQTISYYGAW